MSDTAKTVVELSEVKGTDVNLIADEQVLFDVREAIAGATGDDGQEAGTVAADNAIRRMHNMGLVVRRKHPRRPAEPDLSFIDAAREDGGNA